MAPPIRLVIPDAKPPQGTRHDCPHPGCNRNLAGSVPACRRHRKAWQAAAKEAPAGREATS